MTHPYGMRGAPAVGGGLPGLPRRASGGFNEVIASYSQNFSLGGGATQNITIPFGFNSPAELDLIVHLIPTSDGDPTVISITGSPAGLVGHLNNGGGTTSYTNITLAGNVLTFASVGMVLNGRVHILRRNRRVKQSAVLAASAAEAILPFTITDPNKTILAITTTASGGGANQFLHNYYSAADTNAWHIDTNGSVTGAKITGPSTYLTRPGAGGIVITEFE